MFIAKNKDLIIRADYTKEVLKQYLKTLGVIYTSIEETNINYFLHNGKYVTQEEIEQEKQEQFKKDFFYTSLGYVKRKVTMLTGETKDFLTDILPLLQVGIPILTYTINGEQNKVLVTEEFINECKKQVIVDFYGEK